MTQKSPQDDLSTPGATHRLTPRQQEALATDRNISVTAGAGSGKTTILVERYLKIILEEQVDIRQVLAITFTEKAAAEMMDRVAEVIDRRLQSTRDPREHARIMELRERLNSAQISTIHSFCARVLREFAVASGTDPDFAVLNEFQQELLITETLDDIFSRLDTGWSEPEGPALPEPPENEWSMEEWKELLRQVPPHLLRRILETMLAHPYEMEQLQEHLATTSDDQILSEMEATFFRELKKHLSPEDFLKRIIPCLEALHRSDVSREKLKEKGQNLFAAIEAILSMKRHFPRDPELWQRLINLANLASTNEGQPFKSLTGLGTKKVLGEAHPLLLELSEAMAPLSRFCATVFPVAPSRLDALHLQALRKVLYLYQLTQTHYRHLKEERGVLDFDDLQLLTLKLLREHPPVRNKLRNRYRYIMVDEFQDTNALQWEIISLIGTLEGELQEDKFFVVGDPKQSIYGFRNADVRVFQRVKQAFAGAISPPEDYEGNVTLTESFRFLPGLNRFINHLFGQILCEDPENEFEVGYDPLETRRTVDESKALHLELAVLDQEELKENDLSQEEYVAQAIRRLLEEPATVYRRHVDGEVPDTIRPGDIAILIPRRTRLLELEATLRQHQIPFKTIGGIGFYQRQEIFDVYHLLRFLANPGDDLALVALLRSPLVGISDISLFHLWQESGDTFWQKLQNASDFSRYPEPDAAFLPLIRDQLQHWERRRDRLSLSRLLDEIFYDSFYRATLAAEWNGEQLLANLDKIVEMARDYEQGGFMALADFIESLHQLIELDPREGEAQVALEDTGTVKIMTIHQAKGLEFPVVFCPYLQQIPRGRAQKHCYDADLGIAFALRNPENGYREEKPFLFYQIERRNRHKELAELKRLYYVGATRARDKLFLVGTLGNKRHATDNCLAWTLEVLNLAQMEAGENSLTIAPGVTLQVVRQVQPPTLTTPPYHSVEANLRRLETALKDDTPPPVSVPAHLYPVKDTPKGVVFSATQLLTYKADPETYFHRYHLGFFESDYEFVKTLTDPDNISLLKGKIIHKILEDGLPANEKALQEALEQAFFLYEVFDEELQEQLREEVPELLGPFSQSEFAHRIFSAPDYRTEITLTMRLGEDYFTGTLDRVYVNPVGEWEVADYKTNNITAAEVEQTGQKYLMQMKAYAMLLAQLVPEQSAYPVTLYFLKPGKTFARTFTPGNIREIQNEFLELIREIKRLYPFGEERGTTT